MPRKNMEPWMKDAGRRLTGRRADLGLTIEEVAEQCGVVPSTVRRWEDGVSSPLTPKRARPLAAALRVRSLASLYLDGRVEAV